MEPKGYEDLRGVRFENTYPEPDLDHIPGREVVISKNEILNLVIDLNTLTVEEIMLKHFCI